MARATTTRDAEVAHTTCRLCSHRICSGRPLRSTLTRLCGSCESVSPHATLAPHILTAARNLHQRRTTVEEITRSQPTSHHITSPHSPTVVVLFVAVLFRSGGAVSNANCSSTVGQGGSVVAASSAAMLCQSDQTNPSNAHAASFSVPTQQQWTLTSAGLRLELQDGWRSHALTRRSARTYDAHLLSTAYTHSPCPLLFSLCN